MRAPPFTSCTVASVLIALFWTMMPAPAAAAPLPPAADISWDGRLTIAVSCPQSPADARLINVDGSELPPQPPLPAGEAGTWLLSFPLPHGSGPFLLHGCAGRLQRELIIARPLPVVPAAAVFGGLCVLAGLLCRQRPTSRPPAPATSGWDLAVWDGRQEWPAPLHGPSATLGHHHDCEIIINGPAVAARHVRLVLEADGIRLIDLGHGATFVGPVRRRLRPGESLMLQSDDEIVLGTAVRIRLQRAVSVQPDRR
jgi:hypothetical protein